MNQLLVKRKNTSSSSFSKETYFFRSMFLYLVNELLDAILTFTHFGIVFPKPWPSKLKTELKCNNSSLCLRLFAKFVMTNCIHNASSPFTIHNGGFDEIRCCKQVRNISRPYQKIIRVTLFDLRFFINCWWTIFKILT